MFALNSKTQETLDQLESTFRLVHQTNGNVNRVIAEIITNDTGEAWAEFGAKGITEQEAVEGAVAEAVKSDRPRSPVDTIRAQQARIDELEKQAKANWIEKK